MKYRQAVKEKMIIGVRFPLPDDPDLFTAKDGPIRGGLGSTFVVELEPVSGPIFRYKWINSFFGRCERCGEKSKTYTARTPYLQHWAHNHRCIPLVEA